MDLWEHMHSCLSIAPYTPLSFTVVWMSVSPHVEILLPKVMVGGGGASGRTLGHEGRALMNGISTLMKGSPESSQAPLPWEDIEVGS